MTTFLVALSPFLAGCVVALFVIALDLSRRITALESRQAQPAPSEKVWQPANKPMDPIIDTGEQERIKRAHDRARGNVPVMVNREFDPLSDDHVMHEYIPRE